MEPAKNERAPAYPLPVFNYRVQVGLEVLSFSEVSGLDLEYDKVIYKHGLSYAMGPNIIRTEPNPVTLSLRRGIAPKRSELWRWFSEPTKKDLTIDLCDPTGAAIVRWKIDKALPLKMTAPAFAAASNDVAIETLELIAPRLTLEYL
ncbi:phage tail protein [Hymenobacter sp. CA1UV-4]|nr:phage tail protein [Hymenobacter sp. CA1UV-4]